MSLLALALVFRIITAIFWQRLTLSDFYTKIKHSHGFEGCVYCGRLFNKILCFLVQAFSLICRNITYKLPYQVINKQGSSLVFVEMGFMVSSEVFKDVKSGDLILCLDDIGFDSV